METERLIKAAKQGDKEALVKLVMLEQEAYYKLAYVYMKNKEDALDAMQDMIIILYANIHGLKDKKAFYNWSKTILVNRCKGILKAKSKVKLLGNMEEIACEGAILQREDHLLLEQYLEQLNDKHQEVIRLRYFLDLDYKTIAQLLNIPLGTVRSRISIGLNKLRECLGGEGYEKNERN